MHLLEWKIKVAVLWLLLTVNYVSYILVDTELFAATGSAPPPPLTVMVVLFFVPCLMAWISVISPSMSRWPNVALGAVFSIIKLRYALGLGVEFSAAMFINEIWGFFAAVFVVWYAWKLPSTLDDRESTNPA